MDNELNHLHVPMMEGKIQIGPFAKVEGRDVLTRMMAFDLQVPREPGALFVARSGPNGFLIQAEGPGVFGYLVDSEGFEADESDLISFARPFLPLCGAIRIEGSHMIDYDMRMICRTVIEPSPEVGVAITNWRKRVGASVHDHLAP